MSMCVCALICVCEHMHTFVCTHLCVSTCIYVFVCVRTHVHMHVCLYVRAPHERRPIQSPEDGIRHPRLEECTF